MLFLRCSKKIIYIGYDVETRHALSTQFLQRETKHRCLHNFAERDKTQVSTQFLQRERQGMPCLYINIKTLFKKNPRNTKSITGIEF